MEKKIFNLTRFLGNWYEVARIKNEFEPNMTKVKAKYSYNQDGSVKVINSGYFKGNLRQLVGTAWKTEDPSVLKIRFFPGIYSDYRILEIGNNYEYALIGGSSNTYLWILSRTPQLDEEILKDLVEKAKEIGYKVDLLVMTKQ